MNFEVLNNTVAQIWSYGGSKVWPVFNIIMLSVLPSTLMSTRVVIYPLAISTVRGSYLSSFWSYRDDVLILFIKEQKADFGVTSHDINMKVIFVGKCETIFPYRLPKEAMFDIWKFSNWPQSWSAGDLTITKWWHTNWISKLTRSWVHGVRQ